MFASFAFDMRGFVGKLDACRMDTFIIRVQKTRDWVLRQPIDLQIGMQLAQFACYREVAPTVT